MYELTFLEQSYTFLLEDYIRGANRKGVIQEQIETIYNKLQSTEAIIPVADEKGLSAFHIGQILGETGPLCDFTVMDELYKFAGLNLRKHESGKYKGKLKISKKGRSPLREILGKIVFGSIKTGRKFGEYYHKRKDEENISPSKLIAILERKLLKIVFGMAKNKETFNPEKIIKCESQFNKAA